MWKEELENLRDIISAKGLSANQGLVSVKVYLDQFPEFSGTKSIEVGDCSAFGSC